MQEYAFSFELKTGSEIEDIVIPSYLPEDFRYRKTNYSDMYTHTCCDADILIKAFKTS